MHAAPNRFADKSEVKEILRAYPQFPPEEECYAKWTFANQTSRAYGIWEMFGSDCHFWYTAYCWEAVWHMQRGFEREFYAAKLKNMIGEYAFHHGFMPK